MAVALTLLVCAASVAVWPTLTLLVIGLILVATLAWLAPPFALVGAILLYGLEGAIKLGLARELPGLGVAPDALGAALIDIAFLAAGLGLLRQDRGRTLRAIWENAGRWTRVALAVLVAWLALSLLQIPMTGDLGTALAGFRLTQAYALAILAGAMLLARFRPEDVATALVAVLLVIAAYAAFRAVAGPSDGERVAAFTRATTPLVPSENGVIFRNTGSISSAIGLASFLVPAGVFLFALGLFSARLRLATWIGVALVLVALVGTYVRASLLAVTLGVLCTAAFAVFTSSMGRRAKIALGLATVPLLVVLLVLGALVPTLVSGGSPEVEQRSSGVFNPLSDPSLALRFELWGDALDGVGANPLGTGLGTVGRATLEKEGVAKFADNSYIKILLEQGPLGAILFVVGIFATLIAVAASVARTGKPHRALGMAAVSASVSFFLLAWTSEAIEQPGKVLAWLLVGIALWTAFGAPEQERGSGARGAG
ncbi:MAG: O-antigen ligase family protein [Actinomycetota bacterium]|nr:O-antigen ligase family protein [Actinomycetota bacterium]